MDQTEFQHRRERLMAQMAPRSVALLPAAPERTRNRDVHYPYRQDSDFHYLTGFPEPESVAVLVPGRSEGQYVLFCRDRDPLMETWNGRRAGQEGAVERFGVDEAHSVADIHELLPPLLEDCERIYFGVGCHQGFDESVLSWIKTVRGRTRSDVTAPCEFVHIDPTLHEMRLRKSAAEIELMRRAGAIAAEAHCEAMRVTQPDLHEYEVEAEVLKVLRRHGCAPSYPAIVGGGANGCILHYTENDAPLRDGDLLLIDAGAELECYASDITRTFPVNGRFSAEQRALYDVVLRSQAAAIAQVVPGQGWNAPHDAAVRVLTEGLVDLGLLQGDVSSLIEEEKYRTFYMHRTGHWLGLDVHDVGEYKRAGEWRRLEPGMVTTVEPGLYVCAGTPDVDERWWDIGIRVEDDVAVTENGHEILSEGSPKAIDDVEALMRERPS